MNYDFIEIMYKVSDWFWGNNWNFLIFCLCLVISLFVFKEKHFRRFVGWYTVVLLFVVYNPIIYIVSSIWLSGSIYHVEEFLQNGITTYVRIFYALPISFILAYTIITMLSKSKKLRSKVIILVVSGCLLLGLGSNVYQSGNFEKRDNWYMIPEEVIKVCDIIEDKTNMNEDKRVLVSNDLIVYMRQYDASIKMPYGRSAMYTDYALAFSNGEGISDSLKKILNEEDCNYVVCNQYSNLLDEFEIEGFELVAQTDEHYILKR